MRFPIHLVLFSIAIASCNHKYYAPNTANIPLLSEKGEIKINALYSTGAGSSFNGGELQLAHALTNHIGVMANGFAAYKSEIVHDWGPFHGPNSREKGYGSYLEGAGGYFNSIGRNGIVEVYGGYGKGYSMNNYGFVAGSEMITRVNVSKVFIQPSIGSKILFGEIGFSPRIGLVNWKIKKTNGYLSDDLIAIYEKPHLFVFEPTFIVRVGSPSVKLQIAINYLAVLNSYEKNNGYPVKFLVEKCALSIGASVNFNTKRK
jgi:hypothetical protein